MSIEIEEIKKINLNKGDVLVVSVDHPHLKRAQREGIRDNFLGLFPDNKVLVLEKGFSLGVLTRKDIEDM
jgi:hypothetical protein